MSPSRIWLLCIVGILILFLAGTVLAADFKVQRGSSIIAKSGTNVTITAGTDYTAPADINKAFIRIVNTRNSGNGSNATGGTQAPAIFQATLTNPRNLLTSVNFERYNASAAFATAIDWEIIEYIGPANGPNEIIVRDQNVASTLSGVVVLGEAIATVNNPLDVVIFMTGQRHNSTTAGTLLRGLFTADWNGTTKTPFFTRNASAGDSKIGYAAVEFTGKNWEVQRVEHLYTVAGSWQEVAPLQVLNDANNAFIHHQFRTNTGNNDESSARAYIADTNTVRFKLRSGATISQTMHSVAWIIENTQGDGNKMIVRRYPGARAAQASAPDTWTATITAVRDLTKSSIFASSDSAGTTALPPNGSIDINFTDTTTLSLWRSDANNANDYFIEVVEWPDAASVGAGINTTTFTFIVSPTTKSHTITFGGDCSAIAFFFVETNALFDPDSDGNAAKVLPSKDRVASANCQSDAVAAMTVTNTGGGSTNIDGNFASAFSGSDVNLVLKVWRGTGNGCGTAGFGGWEKDCSVTSTTSPVTETQCKQFNSTNATIGSRLVTNLGSSDTNQLCFSGDFNGFVSAGDHNGNFQTGTDFS